MEITLSEMFLFVWGGFMTLLYFAKKSRYEDFKRHTAYKLSQISKGEATVIDRGDYLEIVTKGNK